MELLLIPLLVVGLGLQVLKLVGFARAHAKRERAWRAVAQQRGLRYCQGSILGQLHGQTIQVRRIYRGGSSLAYYTEIAALLSVPLDLGLLATNAGSDAPELSFHPGPMLGPSGDSRLDLSSFVVRADEAHRAAAALSPKLRELLFEARRDSITIQDGGVWRRCPDLLEPEALGDVMTWCATAAQELNSARFQLPGASELAPHLGTWKAFAASWGMQGMATPLSMWGRLEGWAIHVHAVRVDRARYELEIVVRFPESLGISLWVQPEGPMDNLGQLVGSSAHRLGDAVFDRLFLVRANAPHRLSQLLCDDVRRRLIELQQRLGSVRVTDEGVTLRLPHLPHEPTSIPAWVHELRAVAEAIVTATRPTARGAYR